MKKYGFIIILVAINALGYGQSKQDYHWIFGNDQDGGNNILSLEIDFKVKPFTVGIRDAGLSFDQNNASIADENGHLLFYTNGCAVAGADHEVLMNGDSINSGVFFDEIWLGDCLAGYPGRQDITILTDPGNESGYYIIHKPEELDWAQDPGIWLQYLNYTYVDMSLNNGKGAVTIKNTPFYDSGYNGLLWSFLTSIRHENQKDWWILQPLWEEDAYLTILLTENGFEKIDTQAMIRPHDDLRSSAGGNAFFSPDGNTYAYFTKKDGLHVFDFNRNNGRLSNPRSLYNTNSSSIKFASLEFSSNSELLYYMTTDSLWQVDLTLDNLEEGNVFIEEWNGVNDPFATVFFGAALAPDCRIYIRSGSSTESVHVINKPNERGVACDFVQQGIQFPFTNSVGTWPNSPRWRVDEEEKCDTSIVSIFGELVYYRSDLIIYPNPTAGPLTIELPEDQTRGYLSIVNSRGKAILRKEIQQIIDIYQADLSGYPSGVYYVEYLPKENKERRVYTGKVILE